jgi:hypothetical protein
MRLTESQCWTPCYLFVNYFYSITWLTSYVWTGFRHSGDKHSRGFLDVPRERHCPCICTGIWHLHHLPLYINPIVYLHCSQTVAVLACHLFHAPSVNQVNAHTVSLTLDEWWHKAEDVIAQALDNLETLRSDLIYCKDILLLHTLILCCVKEYLHP